MKIISEKLSFLGKSDNLYLRFMTELSCESEHAMLK